MSFSKEYSESIPANSESVGSGASRIRDTKTIFRERLAIDHHFVTDETDDDDVGKHAQVSLIEKSAHPANPSAGVLFYDKSGKAYFLKKTGDPIELIDETDQTIKGVKTFDEIPVLPEEDPDEDTQAVSKGFLESTLSAKVGSGTIDPLAVNSATESVTLPNGLILKWGNTTGTGNTETVVFPTAFPNGCFTVVACGGGSGSTSENVNTWSITKASFVIRHNTGERPARWFAIGY